ncbi:MAG TPA: nucleotidyltransferase domain-containing protein [Thermoanaerobaculia bacterium]|nr:nucleotidyltransferase domain-containing protein [Thermoanaerobaculia bacterium]
MDTADIEQALREFFADSPAAQGMAAAYLFGSVARGEAHAGSDVDLAVLTASGPRPGLAGLELGLEEQLERLLGRPVQLIVLDDAPVDLVHRVLRDGRLLLDRDPSRRIAFEVKARREFFDLQPILRRYRRQPAAG